MKTIKLSCSLSENGAVFWRPETLDKEMLVENLIKSRLPDACYTDTESIYAIKEETGEILDKDSRLMFCNLKEDEKIKIVYLAAEKAENIKRRMWRPLHPNCKFF